MVKIIGYKQRENESKELFYTLEIQAGVELIKSKSTGNFYATAKKTSIASTFNEDTCKSLIGTELEGGIKKEECEAYTYTIKETGEEIMLNYKYVYVQNETSNEIDKPVKADIKVFSSNEVPQPTI